jgi:hypothetical protein
MSDAFRTIGELLTDERFSTRLLLGDQDATIEAAIPLATMHACSNSFPRAPADVRARRIQRTVMQACRNFNESGPYSLLAA